MKFNLHNMAWLTVVVAIGCTVARGLRTDAEVVLYVLCWLAYAAAPLLLALASSFFQAVDARKRARIGYAVMGLLALMPAVIFSLTSPAAAFALIGFTVVIWFVQLGIYEAVHDRQEAAQHAPAPEAATRRESPPGYNREAEPNAAARQS